MKYRLSEATTNYYLIFKNITNEQTIKFNAKKQLLIFVKFVNIYYFLNINEYGLWSVLLIEFIAEGTAIVSIMSLDDETVMSELQKITPIETIKDEDCEILNYVIDPRRKELSQLINNKLFSSVSTFHKIEHQ